MKRIIAFLISATLLLSLLPMDVMATEEPEEKAAITTLYVGEVNALENPQGEGWSFDAESGVLTLDNCDLYEPGTTHIDAYGDAHNAIIYFVGDLTIHLENDNYVTNYCSEAPESYTSYHAILADTYTMIVEGEEWDEPSKLSIEGPGNLYCGLTLPSEAKNWDYLSYSSGICCNAEGGVDLTGLYGESYLEVWGGLIGGGRSWIAQAWNTAPTFSDSCVVIAYQDIDGTVENENGYNWNNNDAWLMKVISTNAYLNKNGLLMIMDGGNASGEGWTWENNVLTLSEETEVKAIDFRGGLSEAKLTLEGDVVLDSRGMGYDANWDYIPAIKATCNLEIDTGEYSLTLNHDEYGYGIRVQQADLLISGGTVISSTNYDSSIYSEGGNVTVKNATMITFGEVVLCDYYY